MTEDKRPWGKDGKLGLLWGDLSPEGQREYADAGLGPLGAAGKGRPLSEMAGSGPMLLPCSVCGERPKYVVTNNGWTHSYDCMSCGWAVPVRAKTREEGEPQARKLWNMAMEQRSSKQEDL